MSGGTRVCSASYIMCLCLCGLFSYMLQKQLALDSVACVRRSVRGADGGVQADRPRPDQRGAAGGCRPGEPPKELVRKKAVLALHRFQQLDPDREGALAGSELDKHFRQALCDKARPRVPCASPHLRGCLHVGSGSN